MSVTINGRVCRNCYDVDWARRAEAEDIKKRQAEAARKAQEATAPLGGPPDIAKGVDRASSIDRQPAIILDGAVKAAASSAPIAPPPTDTPGQSVNIFV